MAVVIQERRDTAANWTATNPVLHEGEKGYETDTLKEKLGDGVTAWTLLPYFPGGSAAMRALGLIIDGMSSVISTGVKGYIQIPFASTITGVTLLADQIGSVEIDIYKDVFAAYPPTVVNTIVGGAPPTLAAARASQDTTLTGWTTNVVAGDVLGFNVNSIASITRLTIELRLTV